MTAHLNYKQRVCSRRLVDSKCTDLAEHFCADDPRHKAYVHDLAESLQEAVEDFLSTVDFELNEDQL